jgi:hypothetical protein
MPDLHATKIATLNDNARRTFSGCRVVITSGIQALADMDLLLREVAQFDAFTPDNDPYEEHDFGSLRHAGETVFWKFDYYDLDMAMHSPDATDQTVTARVLTIMLANEY